MNLGTGVILDSMCI